MGCAFPGVWVMMIFSVTATQPGAAPRPLTPAAAVANWHARHPGPITTEEVVVELRVRVVAEGNPGKSFLYADAQLPERVDFAVELSRGARAAFERIGVVDLAEHFAGKELEVRGRVAMTTVWCFPSRDLYTVRVESLDQFRAIRAVDAPIGR